MNLEMKSRLKVNDLFLMDGNVKNKQAKYINKTTAYKLDLNGSFEQDNI